MMKNEILGLNIATQKLQALTNVSNLFLM